jgi:hypothetical protein
MKKQHRAFSGVMPEIGAPEYLYQVVAATVEQARTPRSRVGIQRAAKGMKVGEGEYHPHLAVR